MCRGKVEMHVSLPSEDQQSPEADLGQDKDPSNETVVGLICIVKLCHPPMVPHHGMTLTSAHT